MKPYLKLIVAGILLLLSAQAFTQESNVKTNADGKDWSKLKHTWAAKWITHPAASTLDYGVFLFRRSFGLEDKPEKYVIYVSADNRYRLYVNGQKVCDGPARSDLLNWRYETVDIAPYLQKGENIVAAEVVNFGEYRHAEQHSSQTAFILQSDSTNKEIINTGDAKWKVTKNLAYDFIPITSDSVGGYYAAGPCDRIDASQYPWGWKEIRFDDANWLKPRAARTEAAVGQEFFIRSLLVPCTAEYPDDGRKGGQA